MFFCRLTHPACLQYLSKIGSPNVDRCLHLNNSISVFSGFDFEGIFLSSPLIHFQRITSLLSELGFCESQRSVSSFSVFGSAMAWSGYKKHTILRQRYEDKASSLHTTVGRNPKIYPQNTSYLQSYHQFFLFNRLLIPITVPAGTQKTLYNPIRPIKITLLNIQHMAIKKNYFITGEPFYINHYP